MESQLEVLRKGQQWAEVRVRVRLWGPYNRGNLGFDMSALCETLPWTAENKAHGRKLLRRPVCAAWFLLVLLVCRSASAAGGSFSRAADEAQLLQPPAPPASSNPALGAAL